MIKLYRIDNSASTVLKIIKDGVIMSAKSSKGKGKLNKKTEAKQQTAIIYGMVFVLLLGMGIGFFIQSESSVSPPVSAVDINSLDNTEVVPFLQPASHSVLSDFPSMHGEVIAINGTTLSFVDDNGDTQTILQDDAENFYVGQIMHFNYNQNDDGSIEPMPNTAGGH